MAEEDVPRLLVMRSTSQRRMAQTHQLKAELLTPLKRKALNRGVEGAEGVAHGGAEEDAWARRRIWHLQGLSEVV